MYGGQRSTPSVFLSCSPPYFLRQDLTNPEAHQFTWPSRAVSPWDRYLSPFPARSLQTCTTVPRVCVGSGDPNPAPHACIARSLPAEPSPQPRSIYFIIDLVDVIILLFAVLGTKPRTSCMLGKCPLSLSYTPSLSWWRLCTYCSNRAL